MITKEITLCGKQVVLAYCYATEIGYKTLSDEDIIDFGSEIAEKIQQQQMPDIKRTIFLILASMNSYYEFNNEKAPITDKDLMYKSDPKEVGVALGTILGLRGKFYHLPTDEPRGENKEEKDDKEPKNA